MGLEVPRPTERTIARLREVLPPIGTAVGNPIDTGVASLLDPGLYQKAIEIVADDENIDMILVISTPVPVCLENVAIAAKSIKKPLAVSVFALPESEPQLYADLAAKRVAAYSDPRRAVYVLSRLAEYAAFRRGR
jgi:acyl-CoA synthetase (NDP forming)